MPLYEIKASLTTYQVVRRQCAHEQRSNQESCEIYYK